MPTDTVADTRRAPKSGTLPGHVVHPAFAGKKAGREFDPAAVLAAPTDYGDRHMPDDITRDHARRMHYAAFRAHAARTATDRNKWLGVYLALRDAIVLGNRKLVYRAVRRRADSRGADDLIGDCHVVLIQAVAAFNPWMGIRFSTYAYTCLVRALARIGQRSATDRLLRSLPFEALPGGEPAGAFRHAPTGGQVPIDEFLRADHPLLSTREKVVLARRFGLGDDAGNPTLETVGRAVGLSKERVRQVQQTALDKLRRVLLPAAGSPPDGPLANGPGPGII